MRFGLTLLLLLTLPALMEAGDIASIRLLYIRAVESNAATEELLQKAGRSAQADPLMLAYKGAAQALQAKHSWNPYNKMKYLANSQKTLTEAIARRPEDAEIRFLRFSVQHYVPAFLGHSNDLEQDKLAIIRNLPKTSGQVRQVIVQFMKDCGRLSPAELTELDQIK